MPRPRPARHTARARVPPARRDPAVRPAAPPLLVVVTGPPGSGKTAIAEALRERLGLPLLAKDDLKESIGGVLGTSGRAESQRLGVAVFALMGRLMRELLANGTSLIVEGNFNRTNLFEGLPETRIVQVHSSAAPEVLRARLLDRDAHRHPVHYDREAAEEIAERAAAGEWDALSLDGVLVRVETEPFPNLGDVVDTVAHAAGAMGSPS